MLENGNIIIQCAQKSDGWINSILPTITAIGGAALATFGAWKVNKGNRVHRYYALQLSKLYAPLHGLRKKIRALSELRKQIDELTVEAIRESDPNPETSPIVYKKLSNATNKSIEYNNTQLKETLLPFYRQMDDVLRKKL